ncbi:MAG: hypothetical protein IJ890_05570 [Clostridia bacterium]|nr:hypothetical protein [Clostridia bacterium]
MEQEYSIKDKYQVFTIDLSNGLDNVELDTILVSNFLTTFYVDTLTGESINNGKVNIAVTSSKNYPLTFLNGSKYKAQFQKLYLNAQPQSNVSVRIFTSVDCFYEKETPITNAILTQPLIIEPETLNYDIFVNGVTINNSVTGVLINDTLNGKTVKGIKSIIISNLDNNHTLYYGTNINAGNYLTNAGRIEAGEKLSIDFNPQAKAPYDFTLYTPNSIDVQYSVLFSY